MLEQQITREDIRLFNEALERQNAEVVKILNSREYKAGVFLFKLKECILGLKIKSIRGYFRRIRAMNKTRITVELDYRNEYTASIDDYFLDGRIAVYTSIFGKYDLIQEPIFRPNNIDYYIITDQDVKRDSMWKKREVNIPEKLDNVEKNRYAKMHADILFPEYEYSIYVDGSIHIISDLTPFVKAIRECGIAVHKHSQRTCLYEELNSAITSYKISRKEADRYRIFLESEGMPIKYGLCECGIIARKHNNSICKKVMEDWWVQFSSYIKRDQISLPYVLYKNNITINQVATLGDNIYRNKSIRINEHC